MNSYHEASYDKSAPNADHRDALARIVRLTSHRQSRRQDWPFILRELARRRSDPGMMRRLPAQRPFRTTSPSYFREA